MAEKTIKTRIKLLLKSYSEWQVIKDTFIPLAGELCIVNIPANSGVAIQEPTFLFKIGDGISTFAQLNYTSAYAADVYSWAKKSSLNWSDIDETFKSNLEEFISKHAPSQDTIYQIVEDESYKWKLQKSTDDGSTWVDATGVIDITGLENRIATLEQEMSNKIDESDTLILDCNL